MQQDLFRSARARQLVIYAAGFVIACLTLVSLVASFLTYKESFRDCWPFLASIFALLVTIGVEVAFVLLVHGMSKAYMGKEMLVAGIGAAGLLAVMTCNFVVHSHVAKAQGLTEFETFWRDYIGLIVPFATIGLFVVLGFISPEAAERRQLRRMHFIGKERALNYKEEYLNSPELDRELESMRPMIGREVRGYIAGTLPNAAQAKTDSWERVERPPIRGFAPPLDPRDSGKIVDQVRDRYFPRNPHTTGRLNK